MLGLPEAAYQDKWLDANMIQQEVEGGFSIKGSVGLPQFGISFEGSLEAKFYGRVRISDIRSKGFEDTAAAYLLYQQLLALRTTNPSLWDWVNDDFLVTESYHVKSLVAEFRNSGGLSAKVEFEKAGFKASGELTVTWQNENTLELVGTAAVPVAVKGLKI